MTEQNYLQILNEKEKKEILKKLNSQFGIKEVNGIITLRGKERLFLFQGSLTPKKIQELERARINLERLGVYIGKPVADKIRLSIEGTHIFKNQITKNIFELNNEQADEWMRGNEINFDKKEVTFSEKGNFVLINQLSKAKSNKDSNWEGGQTKFPKEKIQLNDFVIIKNHEIFLGCGKASAEKITNFIPKNRRLKK